MSSDTRQMGDTQQIGRGRASWSVFLLRIAIFLGILVLVFFLGPKVPKPKLDNQPMELSMALGDLDAHIARQEMAFPNMRPGNEAQVVWLDSTRKTPYSIVYLHGYSASPREGDPLHREVAARYGANLYLARLADHGLADSNAFKDLTPERLVESAREAIAIGRLIGEKVILMCSSTGGTLGLYLAGQDPAVAGILLYSPNIDLYDPNSDLLTGPWGLQLARMVFGGTHRGFEADETVKKYWTNSYRIEGLLYMVKMVKETMTQTTFEAIDVPLFLAYYYKNEEEQDKVISIEAAKEMFDQISTPPELKRQEAFPETGEHVLASQYYSKDLESVRQSTYRFFEEVLKMKPLQTSEDGTTEAQ